VIPIGAAEPATLEVPAIAYDCDVDGPITAAELSPSGNTLFLLIWRGGDPILRSVDYRSGGRDEWPLDGWSLASTADSVVLVNGSEPTLVSDGDVERLNELPLALLSPYTSELVLAADAGLGTGTGEIPCDVVDSNAEQSGDELWSQKLDTIRAAAAACDYDTLSAIASGDGTSLSFGGDEGLASLWIRETRFTDVNPRDLLLAVTSMPPAMVTPEIGAPYRVWPAVSATDSDADWNALIDAGVYSPDQVQSMRDTGTGYVGFRTGIDEDGVWQFAISGD
jgi:hypothetical protein